MSALYCVRASRRATVLRTIIIAISLVANNNANAVKETGDLEDCIVDIGGDEGEKRMSCLAHIDGEREHDAQERREQKKHKKELTRITFDMRSRQHYDSLLGPLVAMSAAGTCVFTLCFVRWLLMS